MKAQPFVVTPDDYRPALNVLGIKVTVLASNKATQAYEITRQQGDRNIGPPPHSHNWDESFYIVAGAVEFTCGGKTVVCPGGLSCTCPPAQCIAFATSSTGATFSNSLAKGALPHRCSPPLTGRSPQAPRDSQTIRGVGAERRDCICRRGLTTRSTGPLAGGACAPSARRRLAWFC
jgi:hypothetical protein